KCARATRLRAAFRRRALRRSIRPARRSSRTRTYRTHRAYRTYRTYRTYRRSRQHLDVRATVREIAQLSGGRFARDSRHPHDEAHRHPVRALDQFSLALLDPAAHARFVGVIDVDADQPAFDALDALGALHRARDRVGVGAHESARAELDAAVIAHHGG